MSIDSFARTDNYVELSAHLRTRGPQPTKDGRINDFDILCGYHAFKCMVVYAEFHASFGNACYNLPCFTHLYAHNHLTQQQVTAKTLTGDIMLSWLMYLVTEPAPRDEDFRLFWYIESSVNMEMTNIRPIWVLFETASVTYSNVKKLMTAYILHIKNNAIRNKHLLIDNLKFTVCVHKCYKVARFLAGDPEHERVIWSLIEFPDIVQVFQVEPLAVSKALFTLAVERNDLDLVKYCIDSGFDVNTCVDVFDMSRPTRSLLLFVHHLSPHMFMEQMSLLWQPDLVKYYENAYGARRREIMDADAVKID